MRLEKSAANQPNMPVKPAQGQDDDQAFGNAKVDKLTDAMGAQGVAQDSSRVAALASRGAKATKVADALAGDKVAISLAANRAAHGVAHLATKAAPRLAPQVERVAPGAMSFLGRVARVAGKWGPIVSIPFAGYDVAKAVTEHDPVKKRASVANASLTVGGTAIGTAGALLLGTPAGLPLLVGSAAVGAFQLADTYLFKGKATQWLGDTGAKIWHAIKH